MAKLNIQIIGTKKCKETRKAERFFKERGVQPHFRDLKQQGLSPGELKNIANAVGGIDRLMNRQSKEFEKRNLRYMSHKVDEALIKWPLLMHTPVVRLGGKATVGHEPDTWQAWIDQAG